MFRSSRPLGVGSGAGSGGDQVANTPRGRQALADEVEKGPLVPLKKTWSLV